MPDGDEGLELARHRPGRQGASEDLVQSIVVLEEFIDEKFVDSKNDDVYGIDIINGSNCVIIANNSEKDGIIKLTGQPIGCN